MRAVDRVTPGGQGQFLGIVGESGCGSSTLLFAIARLLGHPQSQRGEIWFEGKDMVSMGEDELRHLRWSEFSVVMQSVMNALNPVMTIAEQLGDAIRAHVRMRDRQLRSRSQELLKVVGIDPVHLQSYPHQLSGGMRQRAMIAMALALTPDLVIMDEPTSALDVVAQRSLMVKIKQLQREFGFATIFVTHDMSLVAISPTGWRSYAGQVVEVGQTRQVFAAPKHPYRRPHALVSSSAGRCGRWRAPRQPRPTSASAVGLPFPSTLPAVRPLARARNPSARGQALVRLLSLR